MWPLPPHGRPSHRWVPTTVLVIALLVTGMATLLAYWTAVARDRLRFERAVQETEAAIRARLELYIAILRGAAVFFAEHKEVTLDDFRRYVARLELKRWYPGIQGLGFSLRIPPDREDSVIQALRRQSTPDFRLWPDHRAEERHAIVYLEPLDTHNLAALGYDMFSDPVRREAMVRARDTGQPIASGRVTLVQEVDPQRRAGFLIYLPIYRDNGSPTTAAARRDSLAGFVYGPFRADDFLLGIRDAAWTSLVEFRFFADMSRSQDDLLHDSRALHHDTVIASHRPSFRTTTTMEAAGRHWGLEFVSSHAFDRAAERKIALYILAGGLLMSVVLFELSRAQVRAQRRVAKIAADLLQSEEAMRRAQKFESIGLLAGGVAHDFNNLLTGILGNATFALGTIRPDDPTRPLLDEIVVAAQRAAELTGQLLAYAGKARLELRPVDICETLRSLVGLVQASMPKRVRLVLQLGEGCGPVEGDPNQLQRLFINLIMNGAEAIGDEEGTVTISTQRRDLDEAAAQAFDVIPPLMPGQYMEIAVEDTGAGMTEDTLRQIFDPFFTTKFMGRGLGLAAAQGVVRSHRGAIGASSVPGRGSRFVVLLPLAGRH